MNEKKKKLTNNETRSDQQIYLIKHLAHVFDHFVSYLSSFTKGIVRYFFSLKVICCCYYSWISKSLVFERIYV